ncbi:hypothetical protein [Pontibacillus salipaludis]|uniref:hypothetical protein n=1 Tax=Pontibacillus salipaludis TaxID=1697394 RepID=UPI0031E78765
MKKLKALLLTGALAVGLLAGGAVDQSTDQATLDKPVTTDSSGPVRPGTGGSR